MNKVKNLTKKEIVRDKLYRTSELMDIIPLSQGVIRSMLRNGKMPARKISSVKNTDRGVWVVKGSDLEVFLMNLEDI